VVALQSRLQEHRMVCCFVWKPFYGSLVEQAFGSLEMLEPDTVLRFCNDADSAVLALPVVQYCEPVLLFEIWLFGFLSGQAAV
jgi:hypothetical protein